MGDQQRRHLEYFQSFFIWVGCYTTIVIIKHIWNLFPIFFNDITGMARAGQFDTDFMCFLMLSGLWISWRHHLSVTKIEVNPKPSL